MAQGKPNESRVTVLIDHRFLCLHRQDSWWWPHPSDPVCRQFHWTKPGSEKKNPPECSSGSVSSLGLLGRLCPLQPLVS